MIEKQVHIIKKLRGIVFTKPAAIVNTIGPAQQAMSMERVIRLFTTTFEQICAINEVDKLALERFRIIFQAAKDYAPLLASYEKWDRIGKKIRSQTVCNGKLLQHNPYE